MPDRPSPVPDEVLRAYAEDGHSLGSTANMDRLADLAREVLALRAAGRALVNLADSLWEYGPKEWPPVEVVTFRLLLPEHKEQTE